MVVGNRVVPFGRFDDRPLEERVIAFRRSVVGCVAWSVFFFGLNVATRGVPWFFVPSAFMFMNVLKKGGSIWSDGVGPFEAFRKGIRAKIREEHGDPLLPPALHRRHSALRISLRPTSAARRRAGWRAR